MVDAVDANRGSLSADPRPCRARVAIWVFIALLAALLVWAVEAGSPERIDATGVDGLEVPWSDPVPAEFVSEIDNPWLPLTPGAAWVLVGQVDDVATTRTTTVLDQTRQIAGITATVVRVQQRGKGAAGDESVRFYAQDRDGNVWLLGEEGVWQVGESVPAGLAMPAEPRRGDASIRVPLPGAEREVVRIGESGNEALVPAGALDDLLQLTETHGTPAGLEVDVLVSRGVGEVVRAWGQGNRLELETAPPQQ